MNFTVTLSKTSSKTITVNYKTQNGTATAGSDYVAKSGTLTFSSGTTKLTIGVSIDGDKVIEPNETFKVVLSSAVNATIIKATGTGTILNDDGTATAATSSTLAASSTTIDRSVKVSPNPAINILYAELFGYTGDVTIQLLNFQGKVITQDKRQTGYSQYSKQKLEIRDVASGVYFLVVIDDKGNRQTQKVIIAR
jgi:hypothetical protein